MDNTTENPSTMSTILQTSEWTASTSDILSNSPSIITNATTALFDVVNDGSAEDTGNGSGVSKASCELYSMIMAFVLLGIFLCCIGFGLNCLSIRVFWPDVNKSATNFLLVVLAFVDNGVLICRFVMGSIPKLCQYQDNCPEVNDFYDVYISSYGWAVTGIFQVATIWVTVQIAIHRYIVVCWPHHSMTLGSIRVVRIQAFCALFFSFIFNIPRFLASNIVKDENGEWISKKTDLSKKESYKTTYKITIYYIVAYVIPLSILIFTTVRLIRAVNIARKKRSEMTKGSSANKNKEREDVTVTLIVVVIVFSICQLSVPLRRILSELIPKAEQGCGYFFFYYNEYNGVSISFNSGTNFILYCIFNSRFRKNLIALFRKGRNRIAPVGTRVTQLSTTRPSESGAPPTADA